MPSHQLQPIPSLPDFAQSANKDVFGPLLSTARSVPRATKPWQASWCGMTPLIHAAMLLVLLVQLHAADVTNLRCEYRENPLGIDVENPRLSWIIEERSQRPEVRGQKQTAYQVLVASSEDALRKNNGDLWDSGKLTGGETVNVVYAGKPLPSQTQCHPETCSG